MIGFDSCSPRFPRIVLYLREVRIMYIMLNSHSGRDWCWRRWLIWFGAYWDGLLISIPLLL